jgi:ABC-type nitrate/sulfonate/bicarbonate transport system ATPase subunit
MKPREDCIPGPLDTMETVGQLLAVRSVTKTFDANDGTTFKVLEDVCLDIHDIKGKPQIVSLLGPSGVGKTTLLRLIAGLDQPTKGEILIGNEDHALSPVKMGDVGVVFQRYPLFEDITVLDNLIEPVVRRRAMKREEAKQQALRYLDEFDLVKQGLSYPAQLSGGQRQRVSLLQQLMGDRTFIILDEPFSGLDPVNITNAINLIVNIASRHTLNSFIIITHDVTAALAISDHVHLLGRDRDDRGEPVSGARVKKSYDLIAEGLAYRENIEDLPRFSEIRKEIKLVEFPKL